jgi:hypothetical protein
MRRLPGPLQPAGWTMNELDLQVARWLTGPDGLASVAAVTGALDAGRDELAVASGLRRDGLDPARATAVLAAADARRRARGRWPDADRLLFTPIALEQASDPQVAAWRARRFAGLPVWDLCAGVGGDTLAIGAAAATVTAVDLDPARLELLAHNAAVRGLEVRTIVADALVVALPAGAVMHADPGRRRDGRRVRRLADHLPSVAGLLEVHAAAPARAVVLSPAVALDDPDLPGDAELEFVQVGDRLVEAVLWAGAVRQTRDGAGPTQATATLLPAGVSRSRAARGPQLPVGEVGTALLQVAPAAVRARLHDTIGAEVGARRLARARALLTVDELPDASPWFQRRLVHGVVPARPRQVRTWLRRAEERPVEIAVHGLDADPTTWWRELGRPPRGPHGWRIELVRTDRGGVAIVTTSVPDDAGPAQPAEP